MVDKRLVAFLFALAALGGASTPLLGGGPARLAAIDPPLVGTPALGALALLDMADQAPRAMIAGLAYGAEARDAAIGALIARTPLAGVDFSPMIAAAELYQQGDLAGADTRAAAIGDPLQRLALEWVALRAQPRAAGAGRLAAFLADHPRWPSRGWIEAFWEAALYGERDHPAIVSAAFAAAPPHTPAGKLALASAEREAGRTDSAASLVRAMWRDDNLDGWLEGALLKDFAPLLTRADDERRAERLLYAGRYAAALRAATRAGSNELQLAQAWIAAARGALGTKALNALPASLKADPGLLYARIEGLRHADRTLEAAALMRQAPRAGSVLEGDRWWAERRILARRLLDAGMAKDAYALCDGDTAVSATARIDAEFLAGWIALRFLNDAPGAAGHFAAAATIAHTPLTIARARYWQGRAAAQMNQPELSRGYYAAAAAYPIAYYGQLAAAKLGEASVALPPPATAARGEDRLEATRVVELLYAAGLSHFAQPLALDAARVYDDGGQLAALAGVAARFGDASTTLEIGKTATIRGFALDDSAFPVFGVPDFTPLAGSADLAAVYSVARQESEFVARAASGAGAKGLMQLLPSTARDAARRAGVPFDAARLVADPAFNTQLGAAFLGQLLTEQDGSPILAFAAYNAGATRVRQWIGAYGDPRLGQIDPVDWVERIPFDETRDYVQRVMENLGVYRALFAQIERAKKSPPDRIAQADP